MTGFSSLSVHGYRRLIDVQLPLKPLNVLIGANGVGKSSVLDVFRLLGMSADGHLVATLTESGGLQSILSANGKTAELVLGVTWPIKDGAKIVYDLALATAGALQATSIADERLCRYGADEGQVPTLLIATENRRPRFYHADGTHEPDRELKISETALSQIPPFSDASFARYAVASVSAIHHALDVTAHAPVRSPQTLTPTTMPGANGESLVPCLLTIRETAYDRFALIEDALRVAFPTFQRLEFPPVAAGQLGLGWRDSSTTRTLYANELSEGTLRFLWLATLLQSPDLPLVTLIDEPEVSLHPELLRLFVELLREAAERTQLVVATHSDRLVRFLDPAELLVCDLDDETGGMTVQRGDDLDLQDWLEDYTLDQLWSKGIIGGRA